MDELEQQTREVLEGKPPTQNIFPFQVTGPPCYVAEARNRSSGERLQADHVVLLCLPAAFTLSGAFLRRRLKANPPCLQYAFHLSCHLCQPSECHMVER